jgi:16S rRNA (cytosine967-C5)-methyltransferase
VLHRVTPRVIAETSALQAKLLARAADWVRPGGNLVYAVCSLEPEEGEAQLAAFLRTRADYRVVPATAEALPAGATPLADGTVRTLPGMLEAEGGMDGFFIARLVRS